MDIISHAAWGATIIRKGPVIGWAAFFGALPDFWTIIPLVVYFRTNKFRRFNNKDFWAYTENSPFYLKLDYYSHSLITAFLLTLLLYFLYPNYWYITVPYFLHIFLDIFSHRDRWATRLFYPLSDFHFNGINWWQTKWMDTANWLLLILVNIGIWALVK